jgi:hypothetical protein
VDLAIPHNKLQTRLRLVEKHFQQFVDARPERLKHAHWMFLEGLLSSSWQYWGAFCRAVVMESALGSRTTTGHELPPCAGSWQEVSYIAASVINKRKLKPGELNNELRKEPTWGDLKHLGQVINALELANRETLASSFGVDSVIPHLQIVRNASAHRHSQNNRNVLDLRSYYLVSGLRHPVEALLWIQEESDQFAFTYWLEDMRIISTLAVE